MSNSPENGNASANQTNWNLIDKNSDEQAENNGRKRKYLGRASGNKDLLERKGTLIHNILSLCCNDWSGILLHCKTNQNDP
jgi:hypothetical protein